jgi:hypothetical protein
MENHTTEHGKSEIENLSSTLTKISLSEVSEQRKKDVDRIEALLREAADSWAKLLHPNSIFNSLT